MKKLEVSAMILITLLLASAFHTEHDSQDPVSESEAFRSHIKAVIYIDRVAVGKALVPGYNYYLLKSYADNNEQSVQIDVSYGDLSYVDSLKAGIIDMLAIDLSDVNSVEAADSGSCFQDSLLSCYTADSSSVWLMRISDCENMRHFSSWLEDWELKEGHEEIKALYFKRYDAFRSRPRAQLSPYDSLIRANADSIGVDWRFLAALIYNESRFHIEAKSCKGARGIMQMIPTTAAHYGADDPLDPEINIRAGAQLLNDLLKRYKGIAANTEELYKFALGAYNAGWGRVDDMVKLSSHQEKEYCHWDELIEVLPQMEHGCQVDSTEIKAFNGKETVAYVDDVMAIYREFQRICPG